MTYYLTKIKVRYRVYYAYTKTQFCIFCTCIVDRHPLIHWWKQAKAYAKNWLDGKQIAHAYCRRLFARALEIPCMRVKEIPNTFQAFDIQILGLRKLSCIEFHTSMWVIESVLFNHPAPGYFLIKKRQQTCKLSTKLHPFYKLFLTFDWAKLL